MTVSRTQGKRDTKRRLSEAAVQCIQDKGYAATTARDVAASAEANLASIGYYFGSMEALLEEALIVATERWIGPLVEVATTSHGATVRERMESGLTTFAASLPENRNTVIAFFEALARVERSEALRTRLAAGYDELRAALVAMSDNSVDVASAVIALYDGVMVQWLLDPYRPIDVTTMLDGLARVLAPRPVPRLTTARRGDGDDRAR
jgi:AcrR family transcriptional regulator